MDIAMTMMNIILWLWIILIIYAFVPLFYYLILYALASSKFERSKKELLKHGEEGRKALEEIMKRNRQRRR